VIKLRRFKSRHRVMVRLALAEVVLLGLGGWLTMQVVEGELHDRIDEQLNEDAAEIVAVLDIFDEDALAEIGASYANTDFDIDRFAWTAVVFSPDGAELIIGGEGDEPEARPDVYNTPITELRGRAGEPFTVDTVGGTGDAYRALTFPLADGSVGVVARSLDGVNDVIASLHKLFTIAGVLSVLALAFLVWIISRHVLKPLDDMVDTAHAIGEGNLDARVNVVGSAPDVERLRDAMNTMVTRLQRAFAQQERSEARLRQFVSNASHELRTPLAAILGHAELYHERIARDPEQVERAMRTITAEGTRMQRLVEDLLLLARLDEMHQDGRPLAGDDVDLGALVDAAVASITTVDCEHRFVVTPPNAPVHVRGDEQALRQVVDNLLTNVVVHTPPGTTARISVAADDDGGARLVVADDGPGMDAEIAERVFDRFVRAESSRARVNGSLGGSGLGLSIVDELVRAHGGSVAVSSAPGAGAEFTVAVP
jgi:two-component system OmpR family sensor kinase